MGDEVVLVIEGEAYRARQVINCAGLAATAFAPSQRHYFAKGSYFQVTIPKRLQLPHLVYPAVPKGSPSLGTHLTRQLGGETYLGPDIQWVEKEDYGVDENRRDLFWNAARTFLPWLEREHLRPGYAGIRAKLSRSHFSDFTIIPEGARHQLIHCLGMESPGLTAAMAIGEYVARLVHS